MLQSLTSDTHTSVVAIKLWLCCAGDFAYMGLQAMLLAHLTTLRYSVFTSRGLRCSFYVGLMRTDSLKLLHRRDAIKNLNIRM